MRRTWRCRPRRQNLPPKLSDAEPIKNPKTRIWTSANGKFSVEATFLKSTPAKITLQKMDGAVIDVAWDQLCEADQKFVHNREWERRRLDQDTGGRKSPVPQ